MAKTEPKGRTSQRAACEEPRSTSYEQLELFDAMRRESEPTRHLEQDADGDWLVYENGVLVDVFPTEAEAQAALQEAESSPSPASWQKPRDEYNAKVPAGSALAAISWVAKKVLDARPAEERNRDLRRP